MKYPINVAYKDFTGGIEMNGEYTGQDDGYAAESVQLVNLQTSSNGRKMLSEKLCSVIMYVALAVIALLAIPMCLFLGLIVGVWSGTDKIIKIIQKHSN